VVGFLELANGFYFLLLPHMLSWHGQGHLYPHPKIWINILKPNYACFVWTCNLVTYNEEKTLIAGVQDQVAEENMGEEVTGGWRKSCNELDDFYFLMVLGCSNEEEWGRVGGTQARE